MGAWSVPIPEGHWLLSVYAADEREPGEAYCAACPDHEACMGNWPCSVVKALADRGRP